MSSGSMDLVERRILGGIEFVDAPSGMPIRRALALRMDPHQAELDGPPARRVELQVNRSYRYALLGASGLEGHVLSPRVLPGDLGIHAPRPALGEAGGPRTYALRIDDPRGEYLPRRLDLRLPRDPALARRDQPDSLFQPQVVTMLPAPSAKGSPGWAAVRVRVHHAAHPQIGLPFAVVLVLRDGQRLALGLTDARGEGLVFVPDLPARAWGQNAAGPISMPEIPCTVAAGYDPAPNRLPAALADALRDLDARAAQASPELGLRAVDPFLVADRIANLPRVSRPITLHAGRSVRVALPIDLDPLNA